MYNFAICDDDATFSAALQKLLSEFSAARNLDCRLTLFSDTRSLLDAVEKGKHYDLIFLDILFQSENGIDFAKLIRNQSWNTDIIFVTSNPEYALDGYEAAPLHFLVKPLQPEKLTDALERFLKKHDSPVISLSKPGGLLQLSMADILYFEIYGHDIIVHTKNGLREHCTGTLKEIENRLPAMTFVRPHRSYLIKIEEISEISRYQIRLSSGAMIPISKNLYNSVQSILIEFASKKSFVC